MLHNFAKKSICFQVVDDDSGKRSRLSIVKLLIDLRDKSLTLRSSGLYKLRLSTKIELRP